MQSTVSETGLSCSILFLQRTKRPDGPNCRFSVSNVRPRENKLFGFSPFFYFPFWVFFFSFFLFYLPCIMNYGCLGNCFYKNDGFEDISSQWQAQIPSVVLCIGIFLSSWNTTTSGQDGHFTMWAIPIYTKSFPRNNRRCSLLKPCFHSYNANHSSQVLGWHFLCSWSTG